LRPEPHPEAGESDIALKLRAAAQAWISVPSTVKAPRSAGRMRAPRPKNSPQIDKEGKDPKSKNPVEKDEKSHPTFMDSLTFGNLLF